MPAERAALALKLTNNARIVASQMRIPKLQELAAVSATLNGRSAVMPHLNFLVPRQLPSFSVDIATEATKQ
jgi:hypothetical protein